MDARLREGIHLFNRGDFFKSHERLEELYLDTGEEDKPFLEGLIELAAALRIFRDYGEVKGPVRMVYHAIIRLENYQPVYLGIKVKKLIEAMESWAKRVEADGGAPGEETPKIRLRRFILF